MPSLAEAFRTHQKGWTKNFKTPVLGQVASILRKTSPDSPHGLQAEMASAAVTPQKLAEWSGVADKTSATCVDMAEAFDQSGNSEEALLWYEKAYDREPTAEVTLAIGRLLWRQEQYGRWLPRLQRYLDEVPKRGLGHSQVLSYIADTFMQQENNFAKALPFAERAATSYSGNGLYAALAANEGLVDLQRADYWARELSTKYPTWSGETWYLFRKRTGYDDPEEAKPYLLRAFKADTGDRKVWEKLTFALLEKEKQEAYQEFHAYGVTHSEIYCFLVATILAHEMGEDELAVSEATVAAVLGRRLKDTSPDYYDTAILCAEVLASGGEKYDSAALESRLAKLHPRHRRDFEFLFGASLQVLDVEPEESDRLLRRSLRTQPFHYLSGHLAGHYLVRKHGVAWTGPIEPNAVPRIE